MKTHAEATALQFGVVADSIHLNPARAKLAGGRKGALVDYSWSSLKHYSGNRGPDWLARERVLAAFHLARNGRGRRAYVNYLEERAKTDKGKLSPETMKALRRGWYLGDESFRDKLLARAELKGLKGRKKTSHAFENQNRSHEPLDCHALRNGP